MAGMTPDALQS